MADMAAHATPSWAKTWEKLSEHPSGEFWHHKEDERLRQEGHSCISDESVAMEELSGAE